MAHRQSASRNLGSTRRLPVSLLTLASMLVAAPAASADVLVSAIPKRLVCGAPIKPAIWAQPGTTGDRRVKMRAIDRASGKVWWRKTATARTRGGWREWYLPSGMDGQCKRTTFVYELSDGVKAKYRIRFKSEGV
jgi:hypothetical protein